MKIKASFLLFLLLLLVSCSSHKIPTGNYPVDTLSLPEIKPQQQEIVTLHPGDEITVRVWRNDDLKQTSTIDMAGNLYLPLVGEIKASGMTIPQLQAELTRKLSTYIVNPRVDVIPESLGSYQYFVMGEVKNPGRFKLVMETGLFDAVIAAGGPSNDADDFALLIRKDKDTIRVIRSSVYISDIPEGTFLSSSISVKRNDIIYIPPKNIAEVERFMQRISTILKPLLDIERAFVLWPALVDAVQGTNTITGQISIAP